MNRTMLAWLTIWMAGCYLTAAEASVDKVVTFSNDAKTSVVISYSGAEKIQFFALDAADGVFTLDLPGAFTKYDFSSLAFDQVNDVQQVPLDPDVSKGISVRFFLKDQVDYHVFDDTPGELTLFFETVRDAAPVTPPQPTPVEQTAINLPRGHMLKSLEGPEGEDRFSNLTVAAGDVGGRIFLKVDGEKEFKSFFLDNPKRFVLDLKPVILSLDANRLELGLPLVEQIRIRQFQSHPMPVTRMVLDLAGDANVSVTPHEGGFLVAFAGTAQQLAGLLDPSLPLVENQEESTESLKQTVAETFPAEEVTEDAQMPDQEGAVAASSPNAPTTETTIPLEEEAVITEDVEPLVVDDGGPEESVPTDYPAVPDEDYPEKELAGVEKQPLAAPETRPIAAGTEEKLLADTESAANEQKPRVVVETSVDEITVPDTSQDATPVQETALDETAVPVNQPVIEEVVSPGETVSLDLPAEEDAGESVHSAQPEPISVEVVPAEPLQAEIIRPDEVESSSLNTASEADLQMDDFLNETDDSTLYSMMKGMRSNRRTPGSIVVTNAAVERSKKLSESRSMQEEGQQDDFASLFTEPDVQDPYETIGGGEQEYRGFEISIIDVKDANVVDLLRFLADQVGFNLYVDSSVKDVRATYRFRNIPWDQALDIILTNANLDKEFRNGVLRVATTEKFRQEEQARADLRQQRELSVPVETVTFPLNYADAADVVPIVSEYLSPRGTILMDERTNTLIIEDIPKKMVAIRALIKKLDKMISQVTIEARVVETTKRFLKELGIQWGLNAEYSPEMGTDTGLDFPNRVGVEGPRIGLPRIPGSNPEGGYAVNFPVVAENPSGIGLTLGNFLDNFKLDISLQMLESEGYGQIISSPKITTQNNKTALIQNGQRIPIQTIQRGTITIRYIDAVLELQVTPHITSDETIIMDVVVNKSEPDFTRTVGGNPVINIRKAETKVLVKNGGTAVIGGIFTLNESSQESGIPRLRKVPFLRRIFGSTLDTYENQELLIFVTPRIVKY